MARELKRKSAVCFVVVAGLLVFIAFTILIRRSRSDVINIFSDMQSNERVGPFNGTLASARQFYLLLQQVEGTCRKLVQVEGHTCNKQPRGVSQMCLDAHVIPNSSSCVVYSIGQDVQLSFEEQLMFGLNCSVYMFDPVYAVEEPVTVYLEGKEIHHPIGVRNESENFLPSDVRPNIRWDVMKAILTAYSHIHPVIHFLKLNLHGAEWKALSNLASLGLFSRVQQLSLSTHTLHLKKYPYEDWRNILQVYQNTLSKLRSSGLKKVLYEEDVGHLSLIQMPEENIPRQACGRALYIRNQ